jgi:hypothetical protein
MEARSNRTKLRIRFPASRERILLIYQPIKADNKLNFNDQNPKEPTGTR